MQKAKFLGLTPILVDDVARVHAGAKGKADGRARVVVIRHAVRAALVDACAAFLFQARGPPETRAARFDGGEADRAIAKVQGCFAAFISSSLLEYFLFVTPVSPLLRLGFSAVNSSLCALCARRSSP